MYISEKIKTEVKNEYDTAVCGGGFAGISAALASARHGKKTILFEKEYLLGGLGTLGLVTIFLPLCDGYGKQVSYGIVEELIKLSVSEGAENEIPEIWVNKTKPITEKEPRYTARYNAQMFGILAEKLLLKEGVKIMYGTYVVDAKTENDKITYLVTENKSGRNAYKVNTVVDATGDADIGKFADVPTKTFEKGNVLAAWYYFADKTGFDLKMLGFADISEEERKAGKNTEYLINRRFSGLDADEISEFMELAHSEILKDVIKKRKNDNKTLPVTIGTIPQLRMTRKVKGEYELSEKEDRKYFEDSVGIISNWRKRGPAYEIPFGTLYSKEVKNLIFAGRCTSVSEEMWDIMRVIPPCCVTGQAAGTAAAVCDDFTELDVKILQNELKKDGVILHLKDLN